jgi:(R,R)-butanediol dehydrogenase/meso-butanediol dehydrogenase/diacetyl reductase
MRAAIFKRVGEPLAIEDVPDPTPNAGQVVIKVHRCGICGSDVHLTSGHAGFFGYKENSPIGHEYAGEVVAVGKGVQSLKIGDAITAIPYTGCGRCAACLVGRANFCREFTSLGGGMSEYTLVNERDATRLPKTLSMEDGAQIEPLAVSLHGVALAKMAPGARVHVMGAGPVGLGAIFWAKRLGAGRVVVTATSRRREALAREMGADAFVVPEANQDAAALVSDALGGAPDVVFECAGQVGLLGQAVHCVKSQGAVVSMGFCTSPDPILPALAIWKEVRILFSMTYDLQEFQFVADTLAAGHVEPRDMITDRISLDKLPEMLETLRKPGPQVKVMVDPWA